MEKAESITNKAGSINDGNEAIKSVPNGTDLSQFMTVEPIEKISSKLGIPSDWPADGNDKVQVHYPNS